MLKYFIIGKGRGIRMTTFSPNITNENGEEINGTAVPEEEILDKNSQDVLVIPFGPTIGESVGLLSEQKVHISINKFILCCLFILYVIICLFILYLIRNYIYVNVYVIYIKLYIA